MNKRTLLPDAVEEYVVSLTGDRGEVARRLREETARLPEYGLQIGPDQAAFMAMLVRVSGARRALEIGTFTGYSAMAIAAALPPDGRLICCDVSQEWTRMARRYWKQAGLSEKIELRLGPALETLHALVRDGSAGSFDFAFIDADKPNYDGYYEMCQQLVRPGGLILLDNMLWRGEVANFASADEQAQVLRALNQKIRDDQRVEACLLTVGDGVMMARKRE